MFRRKEFRTRKARRPTEDQKTDLIKSVDSVFEVSNLNFTSVNVKFHICDVILNT